MYYSPKRDVDLDGILVGRYTGSPHTASDSVWSFSLFPHHASALWLRGYPQDLGKWLLGLERKLGFGEVVVWQDVSMAYTSKRAVLGPRSQLSWPGNRPRQAVWEESRHTHSSLTKMSSREGWLLLTSRPTAAKESRK